MAMCPCKLQGAISAWRYAPAVCVKGFPRGNVSLQVAWRDFRTAICSCKLQVEISLRRYALANCRESLPLPDGYKFGETSILRGGGRFAF
ncbi:MAG: hypothetical protein FWH22_10720, partial [Fibromonadales bacterium]|nr:hypothetical protein [Fibromonadales bacterium]